MFLPYFLLCNKLSCMLRLMSMLITLIPMLAQIGCLVFDKADHYAAAFLVPLFLWIGEYVFEFISLLGSAVCLDKRWSHMAEKISTSSSLFSIGQMSPAV